jgi:hypothetical protein
MLELSENKGCPYKPVEVLKINELHQYEMKARAGSLSGIALDFPRISAMQPTKNQYLHRFVGTTKIRVL